MWLKGQVETTKNHHDISTLDLQHTKGLASIPQQRWVLLRKERLIEEHCVTARPQWKLSGGVQRSTEHSLQKKKKKKKKAEGPWWCRTSHTSIDRHSCTTIRQISIFVSETVCVYWAVRTQSYISFRLTWVFKGLTAHARVTPRMRRPADSLAI